MSPCGRVGKVHRSSSIGIRSSRDISAHVHQENFPYIVSLPVSDPRNKGQNRRDGACHGFPSRNLSPSVEADEATNGRPHRAEQASGEARDKKECWLPARSLACRLSETA